VNINYLSLLKPPINKYAVPASQPPAFMWQTVHSAYYGATGYPHQGLLSDTRDEVIATQSAIIRHAIRVNVWRQLVFPVVLPQEEMLPENFVCFGPKFDVDRDEIVSSVSTFLQDTYRGW
jgi:hypothetical protein